MKKNIMKLFSLGLAVILMMGCLTGCDGTSTEIKNLLTEFEYACNTLDIDAMLNCIDPSISDKVKFGLSLYGLVMKADDDETLDQIARLLSGNSTLDGQEFFSSIKIELNNVSSEGEITKAETTIQYKLLGQNYKRDAVFSCVKSADKWYISRFNLK